MHTPTLYLDLLILLASAFPVNFTAALQPVLGRREQTIDAPFLLSTALTYLAVIVAILLSKGAVLFYHWPPSIFHLVALLCAPVCVFLEYVVSATLVCIRSGRFHRQVVLHSSWKDGPSGSGTVFAILVAVGEEFVFRQIWFAILVGTFNVPIVPIVIITSVIYGLNHLYFGLCAVFSKTLCGGVYACLYVFSGYSILVPVLTHVFHNFGLILATRKRNA